MHIDGSAFKKIHEWGGHNRNKRKRPKYRICNPLLILCNEQPDGIRGLTTRIRITTTVGIKKLKIHTDSQLVDGQIKSSFTPKESNMIKYKEIMENGLQNLEDWKII